MRAGSSAARAAGAATLRAWPARRDLLTGEGGANKSYSYLLPPPPLLNRDGGGRLTLRIYELNKPIIAAVNGAAVGVGVTMTLAMDIRLASSAANIAPCTGACTLQCPVPYQDLLLRRLGDAYAHGGKGDSQ